jgi:deoxyribose-phosphate aldolase
VTGVQTCALPILFTLLCAIKDSKTSCGIKVSGGIKTPAQAKSYATLAQWVLKQKINKDWFRIGASSLLDELVSH